MDSKRENNGRDTGKPAGKPLKQFNGEQWPNGQKSQI
jgi:hypothetical protein